MTDQEEFNEAPRDAASPPAEEVGPCALTVDEVLAQLDRHAGPVDVNAASSTAGLIELMAWMAEDPSPAAEVPQPNSRYGRTSASPKPSKSVPSPPLNYRNPSAVPGETAYAPPPSRVVVTEPASIPSSHARADIPSLREPVVPEPPQILSASTNIKVPTTESRTIRFTHLLPPVLRYLGIGVYALGAIIGVAGLALIAVVGIAVGDWTFSAWATSTLLVASATLLRIRFLSRRGDATSRERVLVARDSQPRSEGPSPQVSGDPVSYAKDIGP
ncbi:hypothetical protein ABIA33_007706 [Streptacidiphilus sp. MAP12-16]|uniref:hypothetical protein n=1 Tax=Streptacidiphilus sp. MAP12-16 TaxID=3156300 RepID=UPI003513EE80